MERQLFMQTTVMHPLDPTWIWLLKLRRNRADGRSPIPAVHATVMVSTLHFRNSAACDGGWLSRSKYLAFGAIENYIRLQQSWKHDCKYVFILLFFCK